jgi:hypothetical protein
MKIIAEIKKTGKDRMGSQLNHKQHPIILENPNKLALKR